RTEIRPTHLPSGCRARRAPTPAGDLVRLLLRVRGVKLLGLPFYALVHELVCHSVFCILTCLQLLCVVTQFASLKLELGNNMRILTGHDYHSLWVQHVRYQYPDAHVVSSWLIRTDQALRPDGPTY